MTTPTIDTLDEILDELQSSGVDIAHGRIDSSGDKQLQEARTKILAHIGWVIGEDDILGHPTYPTYLKDRNNLRAEQRTRAGLSGGEK